MTAACFLLRIIGKVRKIQILYLQAGLNVFLYNSLFKFNFLQAGLIFNYIQFRYYIQILYL